jgi:hypothetical protein
MKIALDYDATYTNDPGLWDLFISVAELRGHEVMVVTYRDADLPIDHNLPIPVYYTAFHAKREYMKGQGIDIDVWIDDWPEGILIGQGNPYDREKYKAD